MTFLLWRPQSNDFLRAATQFIYLNWDYDKDQQQIIAGPEQLLSEYNLHQPKKKKAILVFDEIHKYKHWRNFLKGFYDKESDKIKLIVTGSAKMNLYRESILW